MTDRRRIRRESAIYIYYNIFIPNYQALKGQKIHHLQICGTNLIFFLLFAFFAAAGLAYSRPDSAEFIGG
jgi:predicted transporter